jgi:predicted NUDIX family NTP pyrophosphohydrolase
MANKKAAGLLLYRRGKSGLEIFLGHPGGPFWARKDTGAWAIPKGEIEEGEDPLAAAKREFCEETGFAIEGTFVPLTPLKQRGGKLVHAWAVEFDCDADAIRSNLFSMEWPPRSGRRQDFPEMDRAQWFTVDTAREKMLPSQLPFVDELLNILNASAPAALTAKQK